MPNIPNGKKGIYIYLNEEIYSKLLNFIKKKYKNSIYGALSYEIEEAIKYYLETNEMHTSTHKVENPSLPRTHQICLSIIRWLRDHYPGYERFTINELYKAIMNVRGSDKRTLKKWLRNLLSLGYMQWDKNVLKISNALNEAEEYFSKLKSITESVQI